MPLSKKTSLLYVLVYIQQFGAENISVENAIIVITFRNIFEKSRGAMAPASPMAARFLKRDMVGCAMNQLVVAQTC